MTAAPSPQGELVGATLSRAYLLKRFIGAGGMGAVYESKSPEDGRPLAIKVLNAEHVTDVETRSRFLDEGRMCQRLIHPNIVRVFDVGEADDHTPFIVMELLEGVPLSAYTRSGAGVPVAQAAAILQGILAGLAAAHAQGIVHRDLKPENVFLAREANGQFCAKILDFGIAKVMDVAGGMRSKTRTGALLGTPAYMSPEQINDSKDVDARSDLWSAGVMFYEMLTGRVAFPAPTEYARLAAVLTVTPAPIDAIDPKLSRLSAFVQLAMQKDRTQRFQSALEMARALAAAVGIDAGPTPAQPQALSRLPDVPSMWVPVNASPAAQSGPAIARAAAPSTLMSSAAVPPGLAPTTQPSHGPSGTLTSRPGRQVSEAAPQVILAGPVGAVAGTLPSENLPMFSAPAQIPARRGVALGIVVALVVLALAVGVALGFAVGRLR